MRYKNILVIVLLIVLLLEVKGLLAQEIVLEGPLVGQPAVRKMKLLRESRMSIMPNFGVTLLDTYRRNVIMGVKLEYSFFDWLAVGIWGVSFFNGSTCDSTACTWLDTKLTKEVENKARSNIMNVPEATKFRQQVGSIKGAVTLQLTFVPLRGKLGLFKALFLNTDFYLFIGGGIGFVRDRDQAADPIYGVEHDVNDYNCRDEVPAPHGDGKADNYSECVKMKSRVIPVVPTFGGGLDLFINEWIAINVEYRALPMKYNISGTDEYGKLANGKEEDPGYYNRKAGFPDHKIDEKDRVFVLVHTVNIGVAFYFTFARGVNIFKTKITD